MPFGWPKLVRAAIVYVALADELYTLMEPGEFALRKGDVHEVIICSVLVPLNLAYQSP